MSAVERALKKLRDTQTPAEPQGPIAQVARTGSAPAAEEAGSIAFGATGRSIEFDLDALREAGVYARQNPELADQYRVIKRPILKKAAAATADSAERFRLLAVTSALAGEGKTFTAVNLALSLTSEKDWRVLLVDADSQNPQLSRLLGAEQEPGLLNLLKDRSTRLEEHVLPTNIAGLSVLPLGERDEHSPELLSSTRMSEVCDRLSAEEPRQLVIFDTAPLLLTTESTVVCGHVGQVVLVVRSARTSQQAVLSALHKLDENKAIGLVLNCTDHGSELLQQGRYGTYGTYPYGSHAEAAE